jgi:hypothetical protein
MDHDAEGRQVFSRARLSHQGVHLVPRSAKMPCECSAEEACGPGQEKAHGVHFACAPVF